MRAEEPIRLAVLVDLCDDQQVQALVARAGRSAPHILVNNAGGWGTGAAVPHSPRAEWNAVWTSICAHRCC